MCRLCAIQTGPLHALWQNVRGQCTTLSSWVTMFSFQSWEMANMEMLAFGQVNYIIFAWQKYLSHSLQMTKFYFSLLPPALNPTTPGEHHCNVAHIGTRSITEGTFGVLKNHFPCLELVEPFSTKGGPDNSCLLHVTQHRKTKIVWYQNYY